MSENAFYKDRINLSKGIMDHVRTDTPVAIRLRYIGSGTVTSVTTTTATNIVMITSDGGTDTYTFEAYATVGALVDAINADGIFEARVHSTLRSYATASQFVTGAITKSTFLEAGGSVGYDIWDVLVDTSAALYFAASLDPAEKGFFGVERSKRHRIHVQEIKYVVNMGTAAADSVQLWQRAPASKGSIETQLNGWLSVDTTETTISWASGNAKITLPEGYQAIAIVKDAATLADATSNYLDIVGILE